MKWKNRSKHDKGVIIRTVAVGFIMAFSGCLLDSADYKAFLSIILAGSAYMTVFSIVNYDRWE